MAAFVVTLLAALAAWPSGAPAVTVASGGGRCPSPTLALAPDVEALSIEFARLDWAGIRALVTKPNASKQDGSNGTSSDVFGFQLPKTFRSFPPTSQVAAAGSAAGAPTSAAAVAQAAWRLCAPFEGIAAQAEPNLTGGGSSAQLACLAVARAKHQCQGTSDELQALRQAREGILQAAHVLRAFRALGALEAPFAQAKLALQRWRLKVEEHSAGASPGASAGNWDDGEEFAALRTARADARACLLDAVREARALAPALPQDDETVQLALRCSPDFLQAVDTFAVNEGQEAIDATTQFSLGLYFSELGINGRVAPFFTDAVSVPSWARGAEGWHVPGDIARAEDLLRSGEESSLPAEREERASLLALRLYQHAKHLALKHHDAAAEWRYLAAASLAAEHRRKRLAAHSLTRLAYFVHLRGRYEEAFDFAERALAYSADPLASFLRATLGRRLGRLRTSEDVDAAERTLGEIAGRLPSKGLEEQREAAVLELRLWREAAHGESPSSCLALAEAAKVLLCLLCWPLPYK
jgi:tetratricopeptide (TPR) repeat protein